MEVICQWDLGDPQSITFSTKPYHQWSQQCSSCTVHYVNMCRVWLSPPKLPDVTRITSRLTVSNYDLNEFFPHPRFCLSPSAFWLLILVSCFQSHKLTTPNNTAFQVDCSLHNRFPPSSLGIASMTRSWSIFFLYRHEPYCSSSSAQQWKYRT